MIEQLPLRANMLDPKGQVSSIWRGALERLTNELRNNADDLVQYAEVADIDSPDLSGYRGTHEGNLFLAYMGSLATMYQWQEAAASNTPYITPGDGGYWVAIAGRHINQEPRINTLTASRLLGSDADKGLVSVLLTDFLTGTANRLTVTATAGGGASLDVVETGIDHGGIAGLSDDDHTQYHNDARGDARYYTQAQVTSMVDAALSAQLASIVCHDGEVVTYDGEVVTL